MADDDLSKIELLTPADYVNAFTRIAPTESAWEILSAHMAAPDHTATVRGIAHTLGFPNWNTTNLLYGKLAGELCKELNVTPSTHLSVLVTFSKTPGAEYDLRLRPAVVEALEKLGVSPSQRRSHHKATHGAKTPEKGTHNTGAHKLHIVQAGIENGDLAWLKEAATSGNASQSWIVPKNSRPDDEVVVFTRSLGFVATATIMQEPSKREDWENRYGASIGNICLIEPPISLAYIRSRVPELTWAKYPRSITTPTETVAEEIRRLIARRRSDGVDELDDSALDEANIHELRLLALQGAVSTTRKVSSERQYHIRSVTIRRYALARSGGMCELCDEEAPFFTSDGNPYLEVHHILQLSDEGPDDPRNVIALCPNCHRRAHYSADASELTAELQLIVKTLENNIE